MPSPSDERWPRPPLAKRLHPVEDRVGDLLLGRERDVDARRRRSTITTSLSSESKPISARETSLKTITSSALALELLAGPRRSRRRRARRRSRRASGRRSGGARAPARMSSVALEAEVEPAAALARDLPRRRRAGRKSARRGGHQQDMAVPRTRSPQRGGQLGGGLDVDPAHAGGRGQRRRWRRSGSPRRPAGPPAAASARPMRPLERLPMKRTGSIGSRVPPAVTRTRSPSQGRSPAGSERLDLAPAGASGVGQPPTPVLAARGERALLGLDHRDAALAQRRQVRLGGGVRVHPVVHRRRDQRAAPCRRGTRWSASSRRSRRRAWRSCWPRPARRGRRRRWRPARGGRSGRGRAPARPGRRRASGRARTRRRGPARRRCPRRRRRRRSASRAGVISTRTPWPARVARRASSSAL